MKANFGSIHKEHLNDEQSEMDHHAKYLASEWGWRSGPGKIRRGAGRTPPDGYESYTVVDVLGKEFIWMNETFPKEKFKWYLWFESVFLVPEEMVPFLLLKWS